MDTRRSRLGCWVHRHALPLDVVLAVLLGSLSLLSLFTTPPDYLDLPYREGDALGVALSLVTASAVGFRSRAPLAAAVVAVATPLAMILLGYVQTAAGLAGLLTLYTVAATRPARVSAPLTAAALAAVTGVLAVSPLGLGPSDWSVNSLAVGGAWAVGRSVRVRRAYTAGLEERNRALVQASASETRAALAEERSRVAREMQDIIAHSLTAITVQTAAARRLVRRDPDTAEQALDAVEAAGRAALEEVRRVVGVLGPDAGDPGGAPVRRPQPGLGELDELLGQVRAAGLEVRTTTSGAPRPLPPGADLAAYRIVQEALANAVAHAGPATVLVSLAWGDDELVIRVEDDGRGAPSWAAGGGRGLPSLRERCGAYGGNLHAGPRRGGGYAVSATLPTDGCRAPQPAPRSPAVLTASAAQEDA